MRDLFRMEVDAQSQVLTENLLAVEQGTATASQLEALMRAAHSVKGGARIAGFNEAVELAHAMEDLFVAAQDGQVVLARSHVDVLLQAVDTLVAISQSDEPQAVEGVVGTVKKILATGGQVGDLESPPSAGETTAAGSVESQPQPQPEPEPELQGADGVVRINAESMNRLMGLAGELSVETRRLHGMRREMIRTGRRTRELAHIIDGLKERLSGQRLDEDTQSWLDELGHRAHKVGSDFGQNLTALEAYEYQTASLAQRMYHEVVSHRMRPFGEGVQRYHRLVRDIAHSLEKQVRLEIIGEKTQVDREILEKLVAPLTHLIQNAIDHGIESPEERRAAAKPECGRLSLEARHKAGRLSLVIEDDGRGIDVAALRRTIVEKKLAGEEMVAEMGEMEVLEFLFLPGFTLKQEVSPISGRGVGLDILLSMLQQVRGRVHTTSKLGGGTRMELQLPITLSIVRSLLVEIAGEPYAFPIARIEHTMRLPLEQISSVENREYFQWGGRSVGLVDAHQLLGVPPQSGYGEELDVVVIAAGPERLFGLVVDRVHGEGELVERSLDPRLGKLPDVTAAVFLEDGRLGLLLDVDDIIRNIEKIVAGQGVRRVERGAGPESGEVKKRILVVDDSIAVREMERNLLSTRGYHVEVAVDGMDGWNAVRLGNFDLLITDVDMPRMDGIELVGLLRKDSRLKDLPAMIVSYKDRDEDRRLGLEAGADYYLTKGSFQDEILVNSVIDLIGEPE